jgi:hypothetical protein
MGELPPIAFIADPSIGFMLLAVHEKKAEVYPNRL